MREKRLSGSEGGGAFALPTPIFRLVPPGQNTLFRCRIFLKLALMPLRSPGFSPVEPSALKITASPMGLKPRAQSLQHLWGRQPRIGGLPGFGTG